MRSQIVLMLMALGLLFSAAGSTRAADPEIDQLLQSPVGKDWVTNGGNLTNQRYSTLKQVTVNNVGQLKGAWMTRLKGSGYGGKYSFEATPLVKDGIMYVVTGNDDVFALNAKTGEILWERWSGIDQRISTACCGWDNRGLAMGEGLLFLGQLDAKLVALDIKTGKEVWQTRLHDHQRAPVFRRHSLCRPQRRRIRRARAVDRARRKDREDAVALFYRARRRRDRRRYLAGRHRPLSARRRDDLEHAGARSGARAHLFRDR